MNSHPRSSELLAPAGNFEKLKMALHYGADAVYLGMSDFSLRAKADNFGPDELIRSVRYVRDAGKRAYITVNIFAKNEDMDFIRDHVLFLRDEVKPDAIIVADPGVFDIVQENAPGIDIHISTQANVTNHVSARLWQKLGAKRIVLSRELTIDEIKKIRDHVTMELECFVHGSLCIAYSGRCYISSFVNNRSGNSGECSNSCRWNYTLNQPNPAAQIPDSLRQDYMDEFDYSISEEKRPDRHFPIYENDRGTYLMSSHDLCMIEHLDKLVDAGVNSFKIEGRMKGVNYVGGAVRVYRDALDRAIRGERPSEDLLNRWNAELKMLSNRGFTTGLYLGAQPDEDYNHDTPRYYPVTHEFVGIVGQINEGRAAIHLRNNLKMGETLTFISGGFDECDQPVGEFWDAGGNSIEIARNGDTVYAMVPEGVREGDLIRRRSERVPAGRS